MNSFVSSASSSACSEASLTSAVGGRIVSISLDERRLGRRPASAATRDLVELACLVEDPLRGRQVEARPAWRRRSSRPSRTGRSRRCGDARPGPSPCTPTTWPTRSPPCRRSPRRSPPRRPRPVALDERERVEDGVAVGDREAEVRRAAVDDRLAVVADELRFAVDAALGRADIRRPRAPWRAATRRGAGRTTPCPSVRSKADLPVITAVEPARDSVKIESNALSIESVRTYVPLTIATPSTIANAVSAVRSFRPSRPLSANLVTLRPRSSLVLECSRADSSLAARRAGVIAARRPAITATTARTISWPSGSSKRRSY